MYTAAPRKVAPSMSTDAMVKIVMPGTDPKTAMRFSLRFSGRCFPTRQRR
jgi:hypothetical protein